MKPVRRRPSGAPLVRILDVNFNRALEGCRVVEDVLRLSGEGERKVRERYHQLKVLRHRLSFLRDRFGIRRLVEARDVECDPGAYHKHPEEQAYRSRHSMLAANLQRVKESLRVIEEVGRAMPQSGSLSADAKNLRFCAYALEENIMTGRKPR